MNRYSTAGLILGYILMANTVLAEDELFSESPVDGHLEADSETAGGGGDSDSGGGLKFGGPLLLSKLTMQAGGAILLRPEVNLPKRGDNYGGGWFIFNPQLGFFVIDKLEILFGFNLGLPFGHDLYKAMDVAVGFDAGARYFFDFDAFAVYAGGTIGMNFEIPDNPRLNVRKYFNINLMGGVLLAINKHIGVDLGLRFNTSICLGDYPAQNPQSTIAFPMGYLGVDGFFNLFTGE